MTTPTPNAGSKNPPKAKSAYVSSSGNLLATPPLTARISRFADNAYNFFGLYFVSLFSLDPYTTAQNSQFNTRGRSNAYQERARWGGLNRTGGFGSGSGVGASGSDPREGGGGGGGFGGGGSGRRMGTVDDVRGPECGSCG